jgi:hypothetical protein
MIRRTGLIRRTSLVGCTLALALVGVSVSATPAHAVYNPPGVGITHCNAHWTGVMKFSPGLTNGGTAGSETVSFNAVDKPCTGGTPTPVEMKIKGTGTITAAGANDCANFFFSTPPGTKTLSFAPAFAGPIAWLPTSITPSTFSFPTASMISSTPTTPVTFKATGVTVATSYPTAAGKIQFKTVLTLGTILSMCATSGTVVSALKIAGPGSLGKF